MSPFSIEMDAPAIVFPNTTEHIRQVVEYIHSLESELESEGVKAIHMGSFTTAASATTVVSVRKASASSFAFLSPRNADAATDSGSTYATCSAGTVTVNHPASAGRSWNLLVVV